MRPEELIYGCCYLGYLLSLFYFCEHYLVHDRIHKRWFMALLVGGGLAELLLWESIGLPYICKICCRYFLFTGFIILSFREELEKKLFTAALLLVTRTLVWSFGCSFFSCIVLIVKRLVTGNKEEYIGFTGDELIGAAACVLVILALVLLKRRMAAVYADREKSWYLPVSISLFMMIWIVDMVNWGAGHGILVVSHVTVYWDQICSHLAICLLTALGMCIAGGTVLGLNKIYIEQRKQEQYHAQIAYYQMLNEQYLQMERLRHDMKNHVIALYGLWKNDDRDRLGNYLEDMLEYGNMGEEAVTGNQSIDALLYDKRKRAKQNQIRWECDIEMEMPMDEFDLCVLFGNVLDNALNAGKEVPDREKRFIAIRLRRIKRCCLFVVKNYTETESINEIQPGTGLSNIQEVVEKYNGALSMKIENHIFEVSVLLPLADR